MVKQSELFFAHLLVYEQLMGSVIKGGQYFQIDDRDNALCNNSKS